MTNEPQKCTKCNGTKSYQYSTTGTPHSKICEECCPHDKGFWLLREGYKDEGKLCCMAGCGFTKENDGTATDLLRPTVTVESEPQKDNRTLEDRFKDRLQPIEVFDELIAELTKIVHLREQQAITSERERTEKLISEHNTRILNAFQLQGNSEMPIIAYDERICLIPAIKIATKETLYSLLKSK